MRRAAVAVSACLVVVAAALVAAQHPTGTSGAAGAAPVMFVSSEAKWSPAPSMLPEGAEFTVVEGDPTQSGPFTLQLKMPDGYKVPPHWHPTDERLTLVQGTLAMGMGEKWSDDDMKSMTAGSFVLLPKQHPHYVVAKGTAVVQVQAEGPFDLTYINPSDDPRRK